MTEVSKTSASMDPLQDPFAAMPFELILDASGDVDFAELAGEPWGFNESLNIRESATDSSAASEGFSTPPTSPASTSKSSRASPTPGKSSPSAAAECLKPRRPKRFRVPHSQRVKAEKAYLSDQIVILQNQLAQYMASNAIANTNTPPTAWKATAKRQFARRSAAEKENERLRTKLMHQLQIAKSLQVVMSNRAREFFDQLEPRPCPAMWPIRDAVDGDLEKVFEQFIMDMDRAYEAIDTVIPGVDADAQIPLFERRQSTAKVKAHAVNGVERLYVEMRHAYALPFTLDQVKRYFPPAASVELARQNRELEKFVLADDIVGSKFLLRPQDTVTSFAEEETVTGLTKMFVEANRLAMTWRGFMTACNGDYAQAMSVTTGWVLFRPLQGVEGHVAVHVCTRGVPLRSDIIPKTKVSLAHMPSDAEEVGAFTSQMLCTTADIIPSITDSMENMILDDAIAELSTRGEQ